ncbi:putative nucleotidyltransferase with HDIG domain [Sporomusaceae bacterium BoRhaA]|uniref:HD-GYP domain-containing protein n=1 Tax=Pelorhabdus rhamnosifermentans TaxID=2772457 RepID=UPI001C060590|nr:HD domain-containing phosphohydrolase [Pelorhabdus rhamnosifermentans]MBU2700096.1 putative nucleotidyltransferase with HDIG domain [Pelorhabdus rhamnosifermentans]
MELKEKDEKSSMVELAVKYLVPGITIAHDVVSSDGKILVNGGVEVSRHIIDKLQDWQIDSVMIIQKNVDNPLSRQEIRKFVNTYNQSIGVVNKAFEQARLTKEVPLETFVEMNEKIQKNTPASGNIIDQLYNLPPCDDYTFHHSVNVSVIAALLAGWLGYPPNMVNDISLAGLLHDIGKSQLPKHLLHRTDLLSSEEYTQYQQHVNLGYELLQHNPDLPQTVKLSILAHHERRDGSGYPSRLLGDDIHPYAQIIAVADLYDEGLTINRNPDIVYSPYAALEKLKDNVSQIAAKPVITFIDRMTNFLSGNNVFISDGRVGRVVFINKQSPCRPMVLLEDGQVLDLSEIPELQVLHLA